MADFKSEFFNLEKMRNQVMDRIGDYLKLPSKIDTMEATVKRMTSARAADFKMVLPSLKKRVNDQLTASLVLKDKLFAFTDKVQANPELSKVLKGEVGIAEFSIGAIFGKKTDLNLYKDYLTEALKLSKSATSTVKSMEMLKAEIDNVESGIKNNQVGNPLPPVEEPKPWQAKGALYLAGGVAAVLAANAWWKSRRK